jgi:spore coat protein A
MPELGLFQDELRQPRLLRPDGDDGRTRFYRMTLRNGKQKLHAQLPETPFWGYEGQYPGPTIEAPRDREVTVTFVNDLEPPPDPTNPRTQWPFAIDPDQPGGMPYFVPPSPWTVVHLHGSPSRPEYDGWADNAYFRGGAATHHYPRQERAALLWYHDHANMITRLNVYAGLAGLYVVRDAAAEVNLPKGDKELFLLLQHRDFELSADGQSYTGRFRYQDLTSNDKFEQGDFFLVNGQVTPYQKVDRTHYRLRFLNGSNARFFRMAFRTGDGPTTTDAWRVVGVDGGLLPPPGIEAPKTTVKPGVTKPMVVLAPAERLDVIADFSTFKAGDKVELVYLRSNGNYFSPVMQFQVQGATPQAPSGLPVAQRSPRLASPHAPPADAAPDMRPLARTRTIGLYLVGTIQTINGLGFHERVEEKPELDAEEIWSFLNLTGDDHPMHLHLVNFEVIDRRTVKVTSTDPKYVETFDKTFRDWLKDPAPDKPPLPPGLDYNGPAVPADGYEQEPKDTVRATSYMVTRIKTKFRLQTGLYMYHCHILEHEDMEMMRPLLVQPKGMPDMVHGGGHEHGGEHDHSPSHNHTDG